MIIWIIEGEIKKRGDNDLEFVGACEKESEVFDIISKSRSIYEVYHAKKYDLNTNTWVGNGQIIWPQQKYNHAKDGHLDPPEHRDENGKCTSIGLWGPYCHECRELFKLPPIENLDEL